MSSREISRSAVYILYIIIIYSTLRQSHVKVKVKLPDHFVKMSVLSFPSHRLLSGGQRPASVLSGIRSPGCAPWVHVDRGEVPLPP